LCSEYGIEQQRNAGYNDKYSQESNIQRTRIESFVNMYNNFNANVERTIPVSPYLWTYVLPESGTIPVFLNNMDISGGEHPDSIPTSDFGRD